MIDSRDLHYQALNLAISEINQLWKISYDDHIKFYNGNPTYKKLEMLSERYPDITESDILNISNRKKEFTRLLVEQIIKKDDELIEIFLYLKSMSIKIGVASNSIRETVKTVLSGIGVYELTDIIFANEDVVDPKPSPEIYNKTFSALGHKPEDCVVFEDSDLGVTAAVTSGASVVKINSRRDISLDAIRRVVIDE